MLIQCKECNREISNKAYACPHCGFPLKSFAENSTRGKSRKKKRLPNGFGQITKVKGNLRNPYRAMVTVGKTEEGKPICKLLKPQSYFKTYNDAYAALVEYNKNPYEVSSEITCNELYEKWIEEYEKTRSESVVKSMKAVWNYCSELHDVPVNLIRIRHIKEVMKDHNANTKKRIKILWNQLLDYAIEYEITDKNYARMFHTGQQSSTEKEHLIFTEDEMKVLWNNKNDKTVSMILIQCYMGWRPRELCELKLENITQEKDYIIGGLKTKAGKKRRVYVLPAIQNLINYWYNLAVYSNCDYLFTNKGKPFIYDTYRWQFKSTMKKLELNANHRPHDPRKHFITMAKNANVNEYAIKKIVGHEINDITERIYTDRDPDWIKHEMLKITV